MTELVRPMLELASAVPAAVLCFLPMGKHLRLRGWRLALLVIPVLAVWLLAASAVCAALHWGSNMVLLPSLLVFAVILWRLTDLPAWKCVSVFLGVCAAFSCLANLASVMDAWLAPENHSLWFVPMAGVFYQLIAWAFVGAVWYPATHAARDLLREAEMPGTWYVFWILPVAFTVVNVLIQPRDNRNMYAGRIMFLYPLVVLMLLGLLLLCYLMFYLMARGLGENMRLQQKNHLLQMQTAQYEALQNAITETRQARHDLRHHFTAIDALVRKGAWEELRAYVEEASERIPSSDLNLCGNPAADGVAGHYAELLRREEVAFDCVLDLPRKLPAAEMDVCVVLSNLLENALEASLCLPPDRRRVRVRGEVHEDTLVLLEVENAYAGAIVEENGAFRSTKRRGMGVGLQSVRRIAEKNGGYCEFRYDGRQFCAQVMLRSEKREK